MEKENLSVKNASTKDYINASKRLETVMQSRVMDYFDYLNLTNNTTTEYIRYALINKLSITLHGIMSADLLDEITDIVEIYSTLIDEEKSTLYIEKLINSHEELVEEFERFLQAKINYIKTNHRSNSNDGAFSYITNNYIEYLRENYANANYRIDYSKDLSENELDNYNNALKDVRTLLVKKYQDYCASHNDYNVLDNPYKDALRSLDGIIGLPKKDDNLIKKL